MNIKPEHIVGTIVLGGLTFWLVRPDSSLLESDEPAPGPILHPKRASLLARARQDIGKDVSNEVWQDVNPAMRGARAWCQAWFLHQLRLQGLTAAKWRIGGPFPVPLPITENPKPGDMAYWDQPRQHGAMVESVDPLVTIDGAQAGNVVARVYHRAGSKTPIYYSIDPLL